MYQIRKQKKPDLTRAKTTFQVEPKELKLMKISKGVVEGVYGNDYKNQCPDNRKQQRSQSSSKSQSADEQADRYEAGDDKMQDLIMPKDSKVLSAGMAETENLNDGDGEIMSPGPNQWLLPDNRVLTPPSPSPISNGNQRNRYKIQSSTIVEQRIQYNHLNNSVHDPSTQKTASQRKESSVTSTKIQTRCSQRHQSPKKASKEQPGSKKFDKKRLSSDLDHVMTADEANKSKDTPFKKKTLKLEQLTGQYVVPNSIASLINASPKHVIPQKELQHVESSSLSNENKSTSLIDKKNKTITTNPNVIIPKLELANIIGSVHVSPISSTQLKYNQVTVKFSNEQMHEGSTRLGDPQHTIKVGQQVIESNRSKEESNFNLADFDKQISSRIAQFKEAGDQATYRKHNGFQIGGIVGMHQNLQNQDMERKVISHQEKHRLLFEKLSKINNPQEVKASISGINSFIIKNNRNHVHPGLLQAKQRVYLEKGKVYNNQSITGGSSPTSKRSKSLAAGKDLVSVMGTAMQPSIRGPEMYKVIQAAEQFPAREIRLEINKDLSNDLKRLEQESIIYSKRNADQQLSTVRMASISSTTPRGRYLQPTSVIIDRPLGLQNVLDITHGGTNTQSIDRAPAKTCTADQETSPLYSEKKAPSPKFSHQPEQVDTACMSGHKDKDAEKVKVYDENMAATLERKDEQQKVMQEKLMFIRISNQQDGKDELDDYGNVKVSKAAIEHEVNNDSVNKLEHVTSNTENISSTLPEMLTFQSNTPIKPTLDKIVILDEQDEPIKAAIQMAGPSETQCV